MNTDLESLKMFFCPCYLAAFTGVILGQAAGDPGLPSCRLEGVRCHLSPAALFSLDRH